MEEIRKKVFPLCSATLHLIFSAGWEKLAFVIVVVIFIIVVIVSLFLFVFFIQDTLFLVHCFISFLLFTRFILIFSPFSNLFSFHRAQHFLRKQDKLEEKRRKEAKQE